MLPLVSLLLTIWSNVVQCIHINQTVCPLWMYPDLSSNSSSGECMCGDGLNAVVTCSSEVLHITEYFCLFFSEELNSTVIGSCPYAYGFKIGFGGMLPRNIPQLKYDIIQCGHLHRKGQLCGECEDNYTLPVYSYYLGCVKCKDFKYGWIKFTAAAFLPLTFFYVVVIIFRISATSSALNGFVLVSQVMATPAMIRFHYTDNQMNPFYYVSYSSQLSVDLLLSVYSVWNLDYFRSFYKHICFHEGFNLTYPQVLMLDYAVAMYPLLLIFITFILVKLHDNFASVSYTHLTLPTIYSV